MQTITPTALASIIQTHDPESYCIIDTRQIEEYEKGHIPGSIHIPYKNLQLEIATIRSFSYIYVYGTNDEQTARACSMLTTLGVYNVIHLIGGYEQWMEKIGQIETTKKTLSIKQQTYIVLSSIGLVIVLLGIFVSTYFFYLNIVLFAILLIANSTKTDRIEQILTKIFLQKKSSFCHQTERNFEHNTILVKAFRNTYTNALSYAVISDHEMLLVDPQRHIDEYLAFAKKHEADIKGVVFTHIHEDFLMGHTELTTRIATKLYAPKNFPVSRPYIPLEPKETIFVGNARIVLSDIFSFKEQDPKQQETKNEKQIIDIFCTWLLQNQGGNTLASFVGDILDTRHPHQLVLYIKQCKQKEKSFDIFGQKITTKKTTKNIKNQPKTLWQYLCKIITGEDNTVSFYSPTKKKQIYVFPTHDLDTLVVGEENVENNKGKSIMISDIIDTKTSILHLDPTIALPLLEKNAFPTPHTRKTIQQYNTQPTVPLNLVQKSIPYIYIFQPLQQTSYTVIDTRSFYERSKYMIAPAINIPLGPKFFSYLSLLHDPKNPQYYIAENKAHALQLLDQLILGGYEKTTKAILLLDEQARHSYTFSGEITEKLITESIILDVRPLEESKKIPIFDNALQCPLEEIIQKISGLPQNITLYVYATDQQTATIAYSIIKKHNPLHHVYIADEEIINKRKNFGKQKKS